MTADDLTYYRLRIYEELARAETSAVPAVRDVHRAFAAAYRSRVAALEAMELRAVRDAVVLATVKTSTTATNGRGLRRAAHAPVKVRLVEPGHARQPRDVGDHERPTA